MGFWTRILDKLGGGDARRGGVDAGGSRAGAMGRGKDDLCPPLAVPPTDEGSAVATLEPAAVDTRKEDEEAGERWWAPAGATLTEPAPVEPPTMTAEAKALENLLVSHFDGHDLAIPPLHHVAERVLTRLRDRDCNLDAVAQNISEDPVIAATVLRTCNSPLYRGVNPITTLPPAVKRLGIRTIRTLMMHHSLRSAMFDAKGGGQEFAGLVWRRALASACIMRGLSKLTGLDQEDAFLIGLLHDIGSVIVLRTVKNEEARGHAAIDRATFDYLCHECHQEFGELIAAEWKLPPDLKSLTSRHHTFPSEDDPLRTKRLQIQLTDMINSMLGYAPPGQYNLAESRAASELGLAERPQFASFMAELPDQVEEAVTLL